MLYLLVFLLLLFVFLLLLSLYTPKSKKGIYIDIGPGKLHMQY